MLRHVSSISLQPQQLGCYTPRVRYALVAQGYTVSSRRGGAVSDMNGASASISLQPILRAPVLQHLRSGRGSAGFERGIWHWARSALRTPDGVRKDYSKVFSLRLPSTPRQVRSIPDRSPYDAGIPWPIEAPVQPVSDRAQSYIRRDPSRSSCHRRLVEHWCTPQQRRARPSCDRSGPQW